MTGLNVKVSNSGKDIGTDLDGLDYNNVESWRFTAMDDTISFVSSETQSYSPGIPFDMNADSIVILFKIRDSDSTEYLIDTIVFQYVQADLELLSVNCGFAVLFSITNFHITSNVLDSIILEEPFVTTDMQTNNVSFYY